MSRAIASASNVRLALRMTRRELRQHWVQTVLIILLTAIPAGLAASAELSRGYSERPSWGQYEFQTYGDRKLPATPSPKDGVFALQYGTVDANVDGSSIKMLRAATVSVAKNVKASQALTEFLKISGEAPTNAGDVVVSTVLRDAYGLRAGSRIKLEKTGRTVRVLGVFSNTLIDYRPNLIAVAPVGELFAKGDVTVATAYLKTSARADLPWAKVRTRYENFERTFLRGLVAAESGGLVMSSMFVIGALAIVTSRRLRTIAMLRLNGATETLNVTTLVIYASLCGLLGGVLGVAFAHVIMRMLISTRTTAPSMHHWISLGVVAVVPAIAAGIASLVTSRRVAKTSDINALVGTAPQPPVRLFVPVLGVLLTGGGIVWSAVEFIRGRSHNWLAQTIAVATTAIGVALAMPLATFLIGRLLTRSSVNLRSAGRSMQTHARRNGALMAAIAMCSALLTFAATNIQSQTKLTQDTKHAYDFVIADSLPRADVAHIRSIVRPLTEASVEALSTRMEGRSVAALRPEILQALPLTDIERAEVLQAVRSGKAVQFSQTGIACYQNCGFPKDLSIVLQPMPASDLGENVLLPLFVNDAVFTKLRNESTDPVHRLTILTTKRFTYEQRAALDFVQFNRVLGTGSWLQYSTAQPVSPLNIQVFLSILAMIILSLIILAACGLIASETKRERLVLFATGASPRAAPSIAGWTALLLSCSGAWIGALLGIAGSAVFARRQQPLAPLQLPLGFLSVVVLFIPIAMSVLVFVATYMSQRLRRPNANLLRYP